MGGVNDLLSGLKPQSPGRVAGTAAAIAAVIAGLRQAWAAFSAVSAKRSGAAATAGPEGGAKSE
jgi:hypothetical protein